MQTLFAAMVAAALLTPQLAVAQDQTTSQPSAREGNVWDNQSHQPTRDDVRAQEKAAGLRSDPTDERRRADEVEQLDKQVMQRAQQGGDDGVLNGTEATKPLPP